VIGMSFDRWHRVAGGVLLGLLPLLCGCYEFDRPLGPPEKGTIDRALVGTWNCSPDWPHPDQDGPFPISFRAFDATQYIVHLRDIEKGVIQDAFYRVYSTRVGAETLLNARELKPAGPQDKWTYVRYRLAQGKLVLELVDDKQVGGTDEAATRAVRKRVADAKIYSELMTCTRSEEKEEK